MKAFLRSFFLISLIAISASAQELSLTAYDIGSPVLNELYVNPSTGNDDAAGTSAAQPLKTVDAAWRKIPQNGSLTTGYRINLQPGTYSATNLPNYWESRHGTFQHPVILQAAEGRGTVYFRAQPNVFDCRYIYFVDIDIAPIPSGDAFHCEQCDHLLLRNLQMNGAAEGARGAQEALKVNQSQYVYVESSDISGATDNPVDFVSVQYGHVLGNRIHNGEDWCLYAKGGSAYITVANNEFFNCGTGGFTAGQGTGFEFMSSPWLHFEAYDLKFVNNIVHNVEGAAAGVNGGYNILIANNTFYKVGSRSHGIEFVYGQRSCDGNVSQCTARLTAGGWGTTSREEPEPIPNRNVLFLDNVLYNPSGSASPDQHFAVYGPRTASGGSNIPNPAVTDDGLVISGNVIWNGGGSLPLGVGDQEGCADGNPTCTAALITANNSINSLEPQLRDPENGDYRPVLNGTLYGVAGAGNMSFAGGDRETTPLAPAGILTNELAVDRGAVTRLGSPVEVGAYAAADSPLNVIEDPVPAPDSAVPAIGKPTFKVTRKGKKVKISLSKMRVTDSSSVTVTASLKTKSTQTSFITLNRSNAGQYGGKLSSTVGKEKKVQVIVVAVDAAANQSTKTFKVKIEG